MNVNGRVSTYSISLTVLNNFDVIASVIHQIDLHHEHKPNTYCLKISYAGKAFRILFTKLNWNVIPFDERNYDDQITCTTHSRCNRIISLTQNQICVYCLYSTCFAIYLSFSNCILRSPTPSCICVAHNVQNFKIKCVLLYASSVANSECH